MATKDTTKPLTGKKTAAKIPLNTQLDRDVFRRLSEYQKANGHLTVQEVVRVAVASFLTNAGY